MMQPVIPLDVPEEWRALPGFEGYYDVSDQARVRSLPRATTPGGLLRQQRQRGYAHVILSRDGKRTNVRVCKAVARTFLGECPKGMQVRHGPGGQSDDRAVNLSYGTGRENIHDKWRDGTMARGERHGRAKLNMAKAVDIRRRHQAGETQTQLAAAYGVGQASISRVIRYENWV